MLHIPSSSKIRKTAEEGTITIENGDFENEKHSLRIEGMVVNFDQLDK
jgi:hypothetical protein